MGKARTVAEGLAGIVLQAGPLRRGLRRLTLEGRVPCELWTRIPVVEDFEVDLGDRVSFRYSRADGDAIGRSLYWRGTQEWEPTTVRPFLALARRSRRFLDIGANTGLYTLLATAVKCGRGAGGAPPGGPRKDRRRGIRG